VEIKVLNKCYFLNKYLWGNKNIMRLAFKMILHKGQEEEYENRHNPIWKELEDVLKARGVNSYSIFLDEETNNLFGYAEIENLEMWQSIADTDVCQKWWKYMAPLMEVNQDKSPVSTDLKEVFHIDK